MIKVCIVKYKARYCYEECRDFYISLQEGGIPVKYLGYMNKVIIDDCIEVIFIPNTSINLKGLRCDCIVGVSEHEKFTAEYGSKYKHLFKNVDSEARLKYTLIELIRERFK